MSRAAMQMALEALDSRCGTNADERMPGGAIEALRTALSAGDKPATSELVAHPAGEPVAAQCRFPGVGWSQCDVAHAQLVLESPGEWPRYEVRLLYTTPPAAARVPLTPAQRAADDLLFAAKWINEIRDGRAETSDEALALAACRAAIERAHVITGGAA